MGTWAERPIGPFTEQENLPAAKQRGRCSSQIHAEVGAGKQWGTGGVSFPHPCLPLATLVSDAGRPRVPPLPEPRPSADRARGGSVWFGVWGQRRGGGTLSGKKAAVDRGEVTGDSAERPPGHQGGAAGDQWEAVEGGVPGPLGGDEVMRVELPQVGSVPS